MLCNTLYHKVLQFDNVLMILVYLHQTSVTPRWGFVPPAIERSEQANPIGMMEYWNNGIMGSGIM
jgi:hypothetical protein